MEDPLDLATIDDLQFQSGRRVQVLVTAPSVIREGLRVAYEGEVSALARQLTCQRKVEGGAQGIDLTGGRRSSATPAPCRSPSGYRR